MYEKQIRMNVLRGSVMANAPRPVSGASSPPSLLISPPLVDNSNVKVESQGGGVQWGDTYCLAWSIIAGTGIGRTFLDGLGYHYQAMDF